VTRLAVLGLLASLMLCSSFARAHTINIVELNIQQQTAHEFVTSWQRLEGLHDPDEAYLVIQPKFPAHCKFDAPKLSCEGKGLVGPIVFEGVGKAGSTVVLHLRWLDGESQTFHLVGANTVVLEPKRGETSFAELAKVYSLLGIEHIWLGWDHLAFVFGLLLLVERRAMLIKTITAFTIAHSLTLAAATFGLCSVPVPPVEAVIALSIACIALELANQTRGHGHSWSGRNPWIIAFAFGLLHGFGFASAISEIGLPAHQRGAALAFFNVGVEFGQLAFVAAASLSGALLNRVATKVMPRVRSMTHYAMGSVAMYWFFERLAAFS